MQESGRFAWFCQVDSNWLRWLWAAAPLAWVGAFLIYWLRAVAFFGHSPVYLVDKDAFYHGLRGWGCDWIVFGAMLLALALPVWLFVLMHPSGWYRGRHGLRFYGVVTLSVITIGFAIVRDITCFIGWMSIDVPSGLP